MKFIILASGSKGNSTLIISNKNDLLLIDAGISYKEIKEKINKLKTAKWQFYKAIDLNNQVADFHYNLAYTFKKLGNEKQAKAYLDIYNKFTSKM